MGFPILLFTFCGKLIEYVKMVSCGLTATTRSNPAGSLCEDPPPPTHTSWFAWVLSTGMHAVFTPVSDPSRTCSVQVSCLLCLSRLKEMRCYRKMLCVSYKDQVTNEEVGAYKIQQAIEPHEEPPDHRKETQTEVVWARLPFTRSGQNHLARHSEKRKKTRQTEKEMGRQYQRMDWPVVCQIPKGSGEQS